MVEEIYTNAIDIQVGIYDVLLTFNCKSFASNLCVTKQPLVAVRLTHNSAKEFLEVFSKLLTEFEKKMLGELEV